MSDTTLLLKKPTQLLQQDHDRIRELFARCEKLAWNETARKRELFLEIDEEISTHSRIEETLFYPALRNVDAERAREALDDHRAFRPLLEELIAMSPGDEGFDARLKDLRRDVERHFHLEETEIFPVAMRLPRKTLHELSVDINDFRDRPTRKYRPVDVPFYPTLGIPDPPPSPQLPGDPGENKPRGYENWGAE